MDCEVSFWLADAGAQAANQAFDEAEAYVTAAELALSRFRPTSELSALNALGAGRASELMWQVVTVALTAARRTNGLFDPTILPALLAAGYDRPFRKLAGLPRHSGPIPTPSGHWEDVHLDARTRTISLPPGVQIDLGGIAKGWLADAVVAQLSAYGPALADLGGDIATRGVPLGQRGWPVAIADPLQPEQDLTVLALRGGGAIATSGRDYRVWAGPGGEPRHHIIDPCIGRPAETDALSVSVVAASAAEAEVLAKVALLLGGEQGIAYLAAQASMDCWCARAERS